MKGGRQVLLQSPYLFLLYHCNFSTLSTGSREPFWPSKGLLLMLYFCHLARPRAFSSATPARCGRSSSFQETGTCAWLMSLFKSAHLSKRKKSRLSCTIACLHCYFLYWHLKVTQDWFRIESRIWFEKLSCTGPTLNLTAPSYTDWRPSSQRLFFRTLQSISSYLNFYFIDIMLNFFGTKFILVLYDCGTNTCQW